MDVFAVKVKDPKTGNITESEVEANDINGAGKIIAKRGLVPLDISKKKAATKFFGLGNIQLRKSVPTKHWVIYTRQLATMLNAGLPLIQTLEMVKNQTENKTLKSVTDKIIDEVEGGQTLSSAMSKFPSVFNTIFVSMVAAGEASGTLDTSLERLASQQEKDAEIMSKVRGAMVYPAIVMVIMAGIMTFMLVYIFPQVKTYYVSVPGATMPFITTILLGLSTALTKFWWLVLLLGIGGFYAVFKWFHTSSGVNTIDMMKLRTWPFGPLFSKLYMARFARTGATLVASGVPLLQMLQITSESVGNVHLRLAIQTVATKVRGGRPLSDCLQEDKLFPGLLSRMVRVGEQSGALEGMLDKTATYYEKEVDSQVKNLATIIEPLLMVIVGIMAVIMVLAIMMPIYGLFSSSKIQ